MMTFEDYIATCTFKELLPALLPLCPGHENKMADFKLVFDELRLHKAITSATKIHINIHKDLDSPQEPSYVNVSCIEPDIKGFCAFCGYPWDECLGMEISLDDDVHLSNAEIVANCIWEMTFYGFSEQEINSHFRREDRIENKEDLKINELEEKLYHPPFYTKEKQEKYFLSEIPKNRSKKKRNYRLEKRIKQLERISRIKSAIKKLTTRSDIRPEQVNYLFDTKRIHEISYHSCVKNRQDRAQYLVELLTEYPLYNFSEDTRFCLLFKTSSKYPATPEDKEALCKLREILPQEASILWEYGTDDSLSEKMEVLFLGSR
jgi:hypothetical protein